uniref:Uncharacterized protein n=1 Tax=Anguilla anguilla TaxID=7936 RepID=A0A0E9PZD8_ANGAN
MWTVKLFLVFRKQTVGNCTLKAGTDYLPWRGKLDRYFFLVKKFKLKTVRPFVAFSTWTFFR